MPDDAPRTHCELCERRVRDITKHHLIPQQRHRNRRNKREFDRQDVRERVAWLCRPCHTNLHATFSNKHLERELNTLEALKGDPEVLKFTRWIARRPDGTKVVFPRIHYR